MRCPHCLSERSKVLRKFTCEGISGDEVDARYRRCLRCNKTFKTYEGLEKPDPEASFMLADIKRIMHGGTI